MQDLSSYQAHQLKLLKWESEKFLTGVDMIKDEDGYTVQVGIWFFKGNSREPPFLFIGMILRNSTLSSIYPLVICHL